MNLAECEHLPGCCHCCVPPHVLLLSGPWGETVCVLPTGVSHCRAARLQVLFYGYCAQTSELSLRVLAEDRRGQDPLPILVGLTPGYGAAAHPSMGAGGIAPRQWCDVTLSTCCHLPLCNVSLPQ